MELFKNQGKTIIIIAHRLSTIRNGDNIIVLNKGQLVESGTHQELINNKEHYSRVWSYHAGII